MPDFLGIVVDLNSKTRRIQRIEDKCLLKKTRGEGLKGYR